MTQSRVLVFAGDSITDADRRTDPEGLGDGYVRRVVSELGGEYTRIVNAGTAGDRVRDLRDRWDSEVMVHRPFAVSIYVGVNDTWRRFDENDPTSGDKFERDYRVLLSTARESGTDRLVVMEPFLLPVTPEQETWIEDLDEKRAAAAALAAEYGAVFVPLQSVLTEAAGTDNSRFAPDGVHPSAEGSELIARAWLASTREIRR